MTQLISEREKTHGDFADTARIYCDLCEAFSQGMPFEAGTYEISAALDMILAKIARIAAGDPMFEDHWADIIGYSELALASIRKAKT